MMPAHPAARLVVPQTRIALARLELLLDPGPRAMDPHQLTQRDVGGSVAQRVARPGLGLDRAHHQQPLLRADSSLLLGADAPRHRLDHERSLLPVADGQPGPARGRLPRRPDVDAAEGDLPLAAHTGATPRGAALLQVADRRVAGYVQHVALALLPQPLPELRRAAELIIADHPDVGQGGVAPEQVGGDPPRLLGRDLLRDMGRLAAFGVGRPVLGQVQPPIDQGTAAGGGIGQEDSDLAVLDLAQPAAPLAGHATGGGPLLDEAAAVQDRDRLGVGQLVADVRAQLVDDAGVVPGAGADTGLDGLAVQSGLGSDRLAGLALQSAEEAVNDRTGMGLLFGAVEAREVASEEVGQAALAAFDGLGGHGGVG